MKPARERENPCVALHTLLNLRSAVLKRRKFKCVCNCVDVFGRLFVCPALASVSREHLSDKGSNYVFLKEVLWLSKPLNGERNE
jgi:hypothetical protein